MYHNEVIIIYSYTVLLPMNKNTWNNIRIPQVMMDELNELINSEKYKKLGFTSATSLIHYIIRKELESN